MFFFSLTQSLSPLSHPSEYFVEEIIFSVIKERNGDCAVFHAKIFISQGCEEPQGYLSREYENVLSTLRAFFSIKFTHYLRHLLTPHRSINYCQKMRHECLPRLLNCNVTPSSEVAQQLCISIIIIKTFINEDDFITLSISILINILPPSLFIFFFL